MKESGIDLSYDEMEQAQALPGQQPQRLVVITQPVNATTSSTNSSGVIMAGGVKPRFSKPTVQLRACQKLLLMKQKADDEDNRRRRAAMSAVTGNNGSVLPSTPRLSSSVGDTSVSPSIITIKPQVFGKYQPVDSSQPNVLTSDDRSVARTVPTHYYMMAGSSPGAGGQQVTYSAPHSTFRVTSPLSFDDDITSTATSLSEVDEVLTLDQYDQSDNVINELSQFLPQSLIETANYLDSSQIDDEKPIILPASFPSTNSRPYRGGRRRESPPPQMNKDQQIEWEKQRQKKDNHNDIEKRRRLKINENILVLGTLLPAEYDLDIQNNRKGAILEASVKYLKRLQRTQEEKEKLADRERALLQQNRKLALENQKLVMALQQMQATITNACQQQQPIVQPAISAVQDNQQTVFEQHLNMGPVYCENNVVSASFGDDKPAVAYAATNSPDLPIQVLHVNDEIERAGEESMDSLMDLEPSIDSDCLYTDAMLPDANDLGFTLGHVDQSVCNQYSSYHTLPDDLSKFFN